MDKYKEEVTRLNDKEIFQAPITQEEDQRKIINTEKKISYDKGLEEGQKHGQKASQIEIAKNLKERGTSIKEISEICNLSIEEIENL